MGANDKEGGEMVVTIDRLLRVAGGIPWLMINELSVGDVVEILTTNTLYTMRVIDPFNKRMLVRSDREAAIGEVERTLTGTRLSEFGASIKMGAVAVDFCVELHGDGVGAILLSPTREVRVNGVRVLPLGPDLVN